MTNSYFCLLYCLSSSQNTGESTDPNEQELVNICFLIIDTQRLDVNMNPYFYEGFWFKVYFNQRLLLFTTIW